jgi:hypothetical protein
MTWIATEGYGLYPAPETLGGSYPGTEVALISVDDVESNRHVFRRAALCPLLAQSGHPQTLNQRPRLGVRRTLVELSEMPASRSPP